MRGPVAGGGGVQAAVVIRNRLHSSGNLRPPLGCVGSLLNVPCCALPGQKARVLGRRASMDQESMVNVSRSARQDRPIVRYFRLLLVGRRASTENEIGTTYAARLRIWMSETKARVHPDNECSNWRLAVALRVDSPPGSGRMRVSSRRDYDRAPLSGEKTRRVIR